MFRFNRPHFPFGPLEGDGLGIVAGDERIDGFPELVNTRETGSAQCPPSQQAEPDLH